jgi:hypothetical protein
MSTVQTYDFYEGYFNMGKLHTSIRGNKVTDVMIRDFLHVNTEGLRCVQESSTVAAINNLLGIPDLFIMVKKDLTPNPISRSTLALLERAENNDPLLTPDDLARLNRGLLENIYPFPANPITLAMINLLQEQRYTAWVNISFRDRVSVETARARLKKFLKYLNRDSALVFYDTVMFYSAFYEKGDENNRTHIHLFTKGIPDNMLDAFQARCSEEFGETVIEGNHAGAIPYTAKKIHSPKLIELDLRKIIRAR